MALMVKNGRKISIRLPRPLHEALVDLRLHDAASPMPSAVAGGLNVYPEAERWGFVRRVPDPDPAARINPADPHKAPFGYCLTDFGRRIGNKLPTLSRDKRTLPPTFPIGDLLAEYPEPVLEQLRHALHSPIGKTGWGLFLVHVGVLQFDPAGELDARGEATTLLGTPELALAFQTDGHDGPADVSLGLTSEQLGLLRRAASGVGLAWTDRTFDGRNIRPMGDKDGLGLIGITTGEAGEHYYRVPSDLRPLAFAVAGGERNAVALFKLMPKEDRHWIVTRFLPAPPRLARLFVAMGLVRKKGPYDWRLTRLGEQLHPTLVLIHRQMIGVDSAGPNSGVDLTLDDAGEPTRSVETHLQQDGPADSAFDLSVDTTFDEFDIL